MLQALSNSKSFSCFVAITARNQAFAKIVSAIAEVWVVFQPSRDGLVGRVVAVERTNVRRSITTVVSSGLGTG